MPHVLIVDDEPNTRDALAEIVSAEGFTVSTAQDLRQDRKSVLGKEC